MDPGEKITTTAGAINDLLDKREAQRDLARRSAARWKALAKRLLFWKVQCGEIAIADNVCLRARIAELEAKGTGR